MSASTKAAMIIARLLEKPLVRLLKKLWRKRRMKNLLMMLTTALMLTGCATVREWAVEEIDEWAWDGNVPEEIQEPEPEKPQEQSNQRFLWKPASESRDGRAAVLLPARIDSATIRVNGDGPAETRGRTNGRRLTFFLGKTGSAYARPVTVLAIDDGETIATWIVPDGAERHEVR